MGEGRGGSSASSIFGRSHLGCVAVNTVILSPLNIVTVELPDCRSVFSSQEAKEQINPKVHRER